MIAADHAGFSLKESLRKELREITWLDLGTHSEARVDYPDFASQLCRELLKRPGEKGILICGSGQGMAIRANRFSGIRAALCWNPEIAQLARAHNDANVLCLGARFQDIKTTLEIVKMFFTTEYEGGRHQARVDKLDQPT